MFEAPFNIVNICIIGFLTMNQESLTSTRISYKGSNFIICYNKNKPPDNCIHEVLNDHTKLSEFERCVDISWRNGVITPIQAFGVYTRIWTMCNVKVPGDFFNPEGPWFSYPHWHDLWQYHLSVMLFHLGRTDLVKTINTELKKLHLVSENKDGFDPKKKSIDAKTALQLSLVFQRLENELRSQPVFCKPIATNNEAIAKELREKPCFKILD